MIKFYKVERHIPNTVSDYGWYPAIAVSGTRTLQEITTAIMNRCTLTEVDIVACLKAFQREVVNALQNGYAVKLDELGTFRPSIKSGIYSKAMGCYIGGGRKVPDTVLNTDGSVKEMGVTASDIKSVRVSFFPSSEIKNSMALRNLSFGYSGVKMAATKPEP